MRRDDLINYWIAEGFVEEQEDQLLEDIAEGYYSELIFRNLLQPLCMYCDYSFCKMHDLIKQLVGHLSGEECFCGDLQSFGAKILSKLQCILILSERDSVALSMVDKERMSKDVKYPSGQVTKSQDSSFQNISVSSLLNLTGSLIQRIPYSIGRLIHLRLLDVDDTYISDLPESVGSLVNLQILNL